MRLFELDPNNPVDRELAKTAQGAAKDGSLDPQDIQQQQEPDENMPDPSMMGTMDDAGADETDKTKPVDSALLSAVQGHEYVQNYSHTDENARSHPVSITQMDVDELSNLRNQVRGMVARTTMTDRVGLYADPETKAAQDLLSFVDHVLAYKKKAAKNKPENNASRGGGKPKVRQQQEPKTKPGQKFKAKRS